MAMRSKWVLLVDPREIALSVRAFALWVRGFDVLQAGSIEEALPMTRGADLVLLQGFGTAAMLDAVLAVKAEVSELPVLVAGVPDWPRETGLQNAVASDEIAEIVEQVKCLMAKKPGPKAQPGCMREPAQQKRERLKKTQIAQAVKFVTPEQSEKVFASN
jgi:hypothetical protein